MKISLLVSIPPKFIFLEKPWSKWATFSLIPLFLLCVSAPTQAVTWTFSLKAPEAKEVYLAGEMTDWDKNKLAMHKDKSGIWSVVVDLKSGQWLYKYIIDGKWSADTLARNDSDGQGGRHSFIFIDTGAWSPNPSNKGVVTSYIVPSEAWGKSVKLNVYLPPAYNKGTDYPVLVLLHGKGMDADQWLKTGNINNYMDNLLSSKKIQPFVVVMPSSESVFYTDQSENFIVNELPQWLNKNLELNVRSDKSAVAGMSMGGFGAFYLPLKHPELFGFGYALSGYYPNDFLDGLPVSAPKKLNFTFISGLDDGVTASNRQLVTHLKSWNKPFYYREDAGGHTWNFWSTHTAEMLETVSSYFEKSTVPTNDKDQASSSWQVEQPLPIEGDEFTPTPENMPKMRWLGLWQGEWQVEGTNIKGRYEEKIISIEDTVTVGTYSVFDTGEADKIDIPFRTINSMKDGKNYYRDTEKNSDEIATICSKKGNEIWRQWRTKVNGDNIILKVKKIE